MGSWTWTRNTKHHIWMWTPQAWILPKTGSLDDGQFHFKSTAHVSCCQQGCLKSYRLLSSDLRTRAHCWVFWILLRRQYFVIHSGVNVQWQNLVDMAKYVQRWSLPSSQVDIMTTHGPYMLVQPSDVNSWSIYHDCWCHEPHIHFYPSPLLPHIYHL